MFFQEAVEAPPDPVFGLGSVFRADSRPHKVDLMVGIYRNEKLQPELMPSVKKAKEEILSQDLNADYLSFDGLAGFIDEVGGLAFGSKRWKDLHSRVYGAQALGGTGALQIGGMLVAQLETKRFYIPKTTWGNHKAIFERSGGQIGTYSYYDPKEHRLDFEGMRHDLSSLPEKSCVIFHAACHNPTGCDPTEGQWREISHICKKKQLLPFFDYAYQGLGDSIEKDSLAIEIFVQEGHQLLVAYSCSKNFSLYCQRVGALFIVLDNPDLKMKVGSQVKRIIRSVYSNPPAHGAKIVSHILKTKDLREEWKKELEAMRLRIVDMRENLLQRLLCRTQHFEFLRHHKGMFSFADLSREQVGRLIEEFGIYLIDNGRISVAGLNGQNIDRVADAILKVSGH